MSNLFDRDATEELVSIITRTWWDHKRDNLLDRVKCALDADADVNTRIDTPQLDDYTPLIMAVQMNLPELVKLLLDKRADIMLANSAGETALHIAACRSKDTTEVLALLLAHPKIDVNVKNDDGFTPLQTLIHAAKGGRHGSGYYEKIDFDNERVLAQVKMLLDAGAVWDYGEEESEDKGPTYLMAKSLGFLDSVL